MTRKRPVLLGGRAAPRRRGQIAHILFVWLPVILMLLVIARESTASFGSEQTSPVLRPVFESIFGRVSDAAWDVAHHLIRKTGHFLGYGTVGLTFLRAYLLTWLWSFRMQAAAVWRRWSFLMAICSTALVASMDEVHQSYLADRTGMVSDVLLDATGALVVCGICSLFWWSRQSSFVARGSEGDGITDGAAA